MTRITLLPFFLVFSLSLASCSDGPGERARLDLTLGRGAAGGVTVTVRDGLAIVDAVEPGRLDLWCNAPTQELTLEADPDAITEWDLTVRNLPADAVLTFETPDATAVALPAGLPTEKRWRLTLPPGTATVARLAPADADAPGPFRFAVLSDIQEGVDRVGDLFERLNEEADVRFVVSAGDLVDNGATEEYARIRLALEGLRIPFYATCGNHDVAIGDEMVWHRHVGRHSFRFDFRGAAFSFVDSASATVDPAVSAWLDGWLDDARDRWHAFLTHVPPVDPNGVRNGSFSSRKEAAALIARLARGGVDLALFGHVHTYVKYSLGGVECHLSGGGGGWPMRWDGVGRHYLVVDVDPVARTHSVRLVDIGE